MAHYRREALQDLQKVLKTNRREVGILEWMGGEKSVDILERLLQIP